MQFLIPAEQITAMLPDEAPLADAARLIDSVQSEAEAIATKHLASLGPIPVEICLSNNDELAFAVANGPDLDIPLETADAIMTDLKAMLESKARKSAQVQ